MVTLEQKLTAAVADLSRDLRLTVVDLAGIAAAVYQVRLDTLDVPRARLAADQSLGSLDITDDMSFVICAVQGIEPPRSLQSLLRNRPESLIRVARNTDVHAALLEAIANSPIRQRYDLVVGRADPGRNRMMLSSIELFSPGARRGVIADLTVRSVCADQSGTVLAVVAWEDRDSRTRRLLSANSVRLAPGPQRVLAELAHPGQVRFIEPAGATPDHRSLPELMDAVSPSLNTAGKARLVCAWTSPGLRHLWRRGCTRSRSSSRRFTRSSRLSLSLRSDLSLLAPIVRRTGEQTIAS